MPLFSIIVPVYKVEKYLHECVDSVLNQNFKDFEIILVDDGSPDQCPAICDDYASQDIRIKVIHKENGGLSDARNFGIMAATGDYLLFLDSDDYWIEKDFLSLLSSVFNSQPELDVVHFGWQKYYPSTDKFIADNRNFTTFNNSSEDKNAYITKLIKDDLFVACAWNKCIRKQFLVENQLFFKKGLRSEDMDWCGSILFLMPKMTCFDSKTYVYRQERLGSITTNVDVGHLKDIVSMIQNANSKAAILDVPEKFVYLSFYAVQYLTLLFNANPKIIKNNSVLENEIFDTRKILKNDLNYKVRMANRIMMFFGFKTMIKILRLYVLKTIK